MTHSYKHLDNPIAQIEASVSFCECIRAYVKDEYRGTHGKKPPDVGEVHSVNVLDALARIGLRFEYDGSDDGYEAYFNEIPEGNVLDRCLHEYARLVVEDFEENGFVDSGHKVDVFRLVTVNGCAPNYLVFVPDFSGVASAAYFLALIPGSLPSERIPDAEPPKEPSRLDAVADILTGALARGRAEEKTKPKKRRAVTSKKSGATKKKRASKK